MRAYASITHLSLLRGDLIKAGEYVSRSRQLLVKKGWEIDDPSGDYFLADLFSVLSAEIAFHQKKYEHGGTTDDLYRGISAADDFIRSTEYAFDQFKQSLSRELFLNAHRAVFQMAIDMAFEISEKTGENSSIHKAFRYSETFKSLELLQASRRDNADKIPRFASLNHIYETLLDSLHDAENVLYEGELDKETKQKYESRISLNKGRLIDWKEKIKNQNPDYYSLIFHSQIPEISLIQKSLASDQSILTYTLTDSIVYSFLINSDTFYFQKTDAQKDVSKAIHSFREHISAFFSELIRTDIDYEKRVTEFVKVSGSLYDISDQAC